MPFNGGVECSWLVGYEKFATNILLHLVNDTTYRAIVSVEYQRNSYAIYLIVPFSITFDTPNSGFSGTPLFDVEYLRNGTSSIHTMEY